MASGIDTANRNRMIEDLIAPCRLEIEYDGLTRNATTRIYPAGFTLPRIPLLWIGTPLKPDRRSEGLAAQKEILEWLIYGT